MKGASIDFFVVDVVLHFSVSIVLISCVSYIEHYVLSRVHTFIFLPYIKQNIRIKY